MVPPFSLSSKQSVPLVHTQRYIYIYIYIFETVHISYINTHQTQKQHKEATTDYISRPQGQGELESSQKSEVKKWVSNF